MVYVRRKETGCKTIQSSPCSTPYSTVRNCHQGTLNTVQMTSGNKYVILCQWSGAMTAVMTRYDNAFFVFTERKEK